MPSSLPPPPQRYSISVASASSSTYTNGANSTEHVYDALARDFPEVSTLSKEDMLALLEDDSYFDAYFQTIPEALAFHQALERRLQAIVALAEKNDRLRPQLEDLRHRAASLFTESNDLKNRWSYLESAQVETSKRFTPAQQLNRLRAATSGQESLSESLASSFLDGTMDEDDFVRQYREVRKVFHRRQIMKEKFEEGKIVWRT